MTQKVHGNFIQSIDCGSTFYPCEQLNSSCQNFQSRQKQMDSSQTNQMDFHLVWHKHSMNGYVLDLNLEFQTFSHKDE